MEKKRLDVILVEKGFFESRQRARSVILAGNVFVNGNREDKPGTNFPQDCKIELKDTGLKYVSRGGLKLEKAIEFFDLDLNDIEAIDVGASTGGFTHCMLENGANRVICVDVGYGQLDWKIRSDHRVFCMERTNIRYVKAPALPFSPNFVVVDVSFISLKKVIPVVLEFVQEDTGFVFLIKPQFEAGREKVGKKGVVRDKSTHIEVLESCLEFFRENGLFVVGLTHSPIKGPEGNIEFLVYCRNTQVVTNVNENIDVDGVVGEAWNNWEQALNK